MAIDVKAEILIRRARDDVASFAMDPQNDPIWISGILEAKTLTEGPFGKGTKVQRVASFLGRRMHYTPEVVDYEPPAHIVMRTDSPFDMTIRYDFEEADGATRMRINVRGGGSGFFKVAGPLLGLQVKKNLRRDLGKLKTLMESGADHKAGT